MQQLGTVGVGLMRMRLLRHSWAEIEPVQCNSGKLSSNSRLEEEVGTTRKRVLISTRLARTCWRHRRQPQQWGAEEEGPPRVRIAETKQKRIVAIEDVGLVVGVGVLIALLMLRARGSPLLGGENARPWALRGPTSLVEVLVVVVVVVVGPLLGPHPGPKSPGLYHLKIQTLHLIPLPLTPRLAVSRRARATKVTNLYNI